MPSIAPEILPGTGKCKIVHELQANRRHGYRVRLRYADLSSARIARALSRELGKIRGISGVQANQLTKSVLL